MIPLRLELEGIYSYKERQIVDFTSLTDAGLFGIFGPVGSGKSTIPESIMLALYGDPERMSLQNNRASLMHLTSEKLHVEFDFGVGLNNERIFKAVFSLKRKKRNFEEFERPDHDFYEKKGNSWEALVNVTAEDILGIRAEDMRRTMIIPQGKFKEFIELGASNRAEMLQKLFGLDAFDLYDQTRAIRIELKDQMNVISGELLGIGEVDQTIAEIKRNAVSDQIRLGEQMKQQSDAISLQLKDAEKEWEHVKEYLLLSKQLAELRERKSNIAEQNEFIYLYDVYIKNLKPLEDRARELKSRFDKLKESIAESKAKRERCNESRNELQPELEKLLQREESIPQKEDRIHQLKRLRERYALKDILDNRNSEKDAWMEKFCQFTEAGEALLKEGESLDLKRKQLKSSIPEQKVLMQFGQSIQSLESIESSSLSLDQRISKLEKEIISLRSSISEVEKKWALNESRDGNVVLKELQDHADHQSKLYDQWKEKRHLQQYGHLLHDGEPCPLCGSVEHPNPFIHESEEYPLFEAYDNAQRLLIDFSNDRSELERFLTSMKEKEQNLIAEKQLLQETAEGKALAIGFIKTFGVTTIQEAKEKLKVFSEVADSLMSLETAASGHRQKEIQWRINQEACRKELDIAEKACVEVQTKWDSIEEELNKNEDDFWKSYLDKSDEEISKDIAVVERFILDTKMKSVEVKKRLDALNSELSGLDLLILESEKNFNELEIERRDCEDTLQKEQVKYQWTSAAQEKVSRFIGDIDSLRKSSNDFAIEWSNVTKRLDELKGISTTSRLTIEVLEELRTREAKAKADFQIFSESLGKLKAELEAIESALKRKLEKEKELDDLQLRDDRFSQLEKLFKGKGFVKFISGFYLEELCRAANKRFMALTRNRLRIELNDDLEFMVRDYLNGGKTRKMSTLSGGQTFQASLCLALALSERVKSIHQSGRSFFFLDEGFGSLDRESLAMVFESLKSLRKENRVVGIISHVEELKQEIEVGLRIELDVERGSLIK